MQLCFFEDSLLPRFHPLTLTRPIDDLRVGILTIREKWERAFSADESLRQPRPELSALFPAGEIDPSEPCCWINARYLPDKGLVDHITALDPGSMIADKETVIAALAGGAQSADWLEQGEPDFSSLMVSESDTQRSIEHLWDLFLLNGAEIANDIALLQPIEGRNRKAAAEITMMNAEQIYIEPNVVIEPGVILNAEKGPIYIGKGSVIQSGSMLRGPVAVGAGATLKMGAKIYEATTIGPVCKVGGEVNNSIFHSYSNKGHEGFVGNSLIGQWCNFGADTNTSNLKNNYSTIRLTDWESRREIETGQQFIGTIMGDQSKTAINTQLNTGTVCGVSCNIFSSEFPPKLIPSFSWVGTTVIQPYRFEKAIDTMEAMMARRDMAMTDDYRALMKHIFDRRRD